MVTIAESQACLGWGILTARAEPEGDGDVTYSQLAELLGAHERGLAPMLELIMNHCRGSGLPPLTGLVVLKGQGVPSSGFPEEELSRIPDVYRFNWKTTANPFEYARGQ